MILYNFRMAGLRGGRTAPAGRNSLSLCPPCPLWQRSFSFFICVICAICGFLFFSTGCVVTETWEGCDGKFYSSATGDLDQEKEPYRSPYLPRLEPVCLGAPGDNAIRTPDAIRFNWRDESEIRYTKVVISTEKLRYSAKTRRFNTEIIAAVWDTSMKGVPGYLSLSDFQKAAGGLSADTVWDFELNRNYLWTVWGFDRLGRMNYAAQERTFILMEIEGLTE